MTKFQVSAGIVLVIVAVTALFLRQHDQNKQSRAENVALQEEAAQLRLENQRLTDALKSSAALSQADLRDLMRLRAQATRMSQTEQEAAQLKTERDHLAAQLSQISQGASEVRTEQTREQNLRMAKINTAKMVSLTFFMFADDNGGRFPTNFTDVAAYTSGQPPGFGNDQFEIAYKGPQMKDPGEIILLKEKEPTQRADGQWEKVYAFCDGHVEVQTSADGNFDAWEKKHAASEGSVSGP